VLRLVPARMILMAMAGTGCLLWLALPWLAPRAWRKTTTAAGTTELIAVFVEDPRRTVPALRLWKNRPGSVLVFLGGPASQQVNQKYLEFWKPEGSEEVFRGLRQPVLLTPGCDTVGQLANLTTWTARFGTPGRLTLVTTDRHLERARTIATELLGSRGWRVEGVAVSNLDTHIEGTWRRHRDQLRASLWRATGWDGRLLPINCYPQPTAAVLPLP
jgi:hypothetical protein